MGAVAYPLITIVTAGSLFIALQGHNRARATADSEVRVLAMSAARDADRFIEGRLHVLASVAQTDAVRQLDLPRMQALLQRLPEATSFAEMAWVDRDGTLRAYSEGLPDGARVGYEDRDAVQEALTTGRPAIGTAVQGRLNPALTVPMGYPTRDSEGVVTGAIVTGIRLDGTLGGQIHFGGVPGLRVIDRSGRLIIAEGPVSDLRDITGWEGAAETWSGAPGVFRGPGVLGEPDHVVGYARTVRAGWLVLVDQHESEVYGSVDAVLRLEFVGIVLFTIFAGSGVSWVMIRLERDAARAWEAEEEATRARRLRDELIASLGHDLGNPLTIIRGHAGLLRRRLPPDNPSPLEIEQSARRMQRMIQGLMDLSRSGAEVELSRDEMDLVPVVRMLVEERQVLDRGREFVVDAQSERLPGLWDRLRIERAIDNLLSNAVKYSPPDSRVTIRLWREQEAPGREWAVIQVEDEGIGIPASEQERVFEAFYRGSNTAGQSGSGLGLSSVRRVAEQHGGSVRIESTERVGTRVRLRLPLDPYAAAAAELEETAPGK